MELQEEMKGKRILFYIPGGNLESNGVYASQVGGLKRYVESLGAETLVFQNVIQGRMKFWQVIPYVRRETAQRKDLIEFKPTHIYVRTFGSCIAAQKLAEETGAKIVYSIRGADAAEALLDGDFRGYVLALYAAWGVKKAVKYADHINVVSHAMADWIESKYGRKASVLPCCVEDRAFAQCDKPEGNNGKTIIYSGGLSKWQKIAEIIALMKRLADANATLKFRFLTKDVDGLKEKCEKIGLPEGRWSAMACRQDEVPMELAKADCGIILRDDILVNRVASPIKIGEYLAAGLALIVSPGIGDVSRLLSGKPFVKVLNGDESEISGMVSFVNQMSSDTKEASRDFAKEYYTYSGNHDAVKEMFQ